MKKEKIIIDRFFLAEEIKKCLIKDDQQKQSDDKLKEGEKK